MECTMSSAAKSWSCTISLRTDYDHTGKALAQSSKVLFGAPLTNKNEVDIWLRRAQSAILNPSLPPESFYQMPYAELRGRANALKFSKNVVHISIEDPEATDLSFVDLPGLIQNEEKEVIEIVRSMVETYISRENTIILTTIPMSDDMENQLAVKLAKEADPEGERTIGILTKPDNVGPGDVSKRQTWRNVLEGREHILTHGYYCVRLPNDAERAEKLTRAEAQARALGFFNSTKPWSEIADRGRFGIPGFVNDISELLIQLIEKALPKLKKEIEKLLANCADNLDKLPPLILNNPVAEVISRVNAFCEGLKSAVYGREEQGFAQRDRAVFAILKRSIRLTAPDFRPFADPENYRSMDESETDLQESPGLKFPNPAVPVLGLYQVRKTIQESIGWELPNNVPYEAKKVLIDGFTSMWKEPSMKCFTDIHSNLLKFVEELIAKHFGQFKMLENYVGNLIREEVKEHEALARVALEETLKLEIDPCFTQNTHYFDTLRNAWLAKYKHAIHDPMYRRVDLHDIGPSCRHSYSASEHVYEGAFTRADVSQALRSLAQAGYKDLKIEDLARLLPPNGFEDELIVMADVRAYFNVAYKRIIDYVPLKIEHSLNRALADKLPESLLNNLMKTPNLLDRMAEFVSEDPAITARRAELRTRRSRLVNIQQKLANFGM
ncbi:hypothetical protein SERLADRAFT_471404 [Serpula lacrymans var. lacrymans S7.9]|nr:uncharacterized protein SERLADRAFT_471404 [Serpula lacrymans var. lacrymans S7.9]EGO22889.1 hypothetical protein SERLADRAFT_471404 [Serpula lacrymans var. lacrymans S7.9]